MAVTCRTGIMIMMMLVVYCLFVFGCAICLYFRLWVCNTVIPLCTAKRLSYDIASISETTTQIDKKFHNMCTTKMCPAMQYCEVITNPRWRTAAILKIVKLPYLSEKLSNFDEIRHTTANVEPDCSHVTQN